ncbi:hypothetical protein EGX46_19780 [Yersinia pestis]|nr:hypothetical protein EGX46_19780 [Yersinia pestis]
MDHYCTVRYNTAPDRTWSALITEVNVKRKPPFKPRLDEHISIYTEARSHFLQSGKIVRHIFPLNP